jgi:D-arginine dehydrogenase
MSDFDIVIVGAGMAGASIAAGLAGHFSILMIEAEAHPGYHATGRSAAFWTESYGGPSVQPLTTASGPFLLNPPLDFADVVLMTKRGALYIGNNCDKPLAEKMLYDFCNSDIAFEVLERARIEIHVPGIRSEWNQGLWEPSCCDINVAALHAAYLRQAKREGVQLRCNTPLRKATFSDGAWQIETGNGNFNAKLLINAAGAWADDVARTAGIMPIGITPYRRTIIELAVEPMAHATLPLVIALDESFYFKPDAGRIWLSPHDETPSLAIDAAAEEIDVAQAIERFQNVVDWRIIGVEHKWAGLRSFAPDRLPVIGHDPERPEFFWFAGQGGFGIQTAPAAAQLAASLIEPDISRPAHVEADLYTPNRLR